MMRTSTKWDSQQKRILKHLVLQHGIAFMRYFFSLRDGTTMLRNWHHYEIEKALQKTIDGVYNRLIINIPPGYTKTEQAVLNYICRGLAINPRAKFIHASYSGDLANENSSKIKETIESEEFQELFPMALKMDSKGKKRWYTSKGGGMMAAPAGGQITGFRAGRMEEGFTGAFVIDDPVKPDDAYSDVKRNRINQRFNSTMRSRLAIESVPMIIIMQRLHDEDLTGFLLQGGSEDKWHHLELPAMIDEKYLEQEYPKEYTHGIPIKCDMQTGPLWPFKHSAEALRLLEKGDPYVYSGQMQQRPSPLGGSMFKDEWWKYYDMLPADIDLIRIYGDTAEKTAERNDYSVLIAIGRSPSQGIFIIDLMRGKWEAPELERQVVSFWNKHKPTQFKPQGAQVMKIEDKSSGTGLIQAIKTEHQIPIEGIQRNKDKVTRAMAGVKYFAGGYVHVPREAEWLFDYKQEFRKFTPLMTHKHDDQIDPTMDGVEDLLIFRDSLYSESNVG